MAKKYKKNTTKYGTIHTTTTTKRKKSFLMSTKRCDVNRMPQAQTHTRLPPPAYAPRLSH